MGLGTVFQTGHSGMTAAKTAVATAGHNIANSNTEGFSRQRVVTESQAPGGKQGTQMLIGRGTKVAEIGRFNDSYLEKQIRTANRHMEGAEEKQLALQQVENIFNEMDGEGLNRIMSRFFNDFRKLSQDPDSDAARQAVRESSKALVKDVKRIRTELIEVRNYMDHRLEGYTREINSLSKSIKELNFKIRNIEVTGYTQANDLRDQRDLATKKLAAFLDISSQVDEAGSALISIKGVGPLVTGADFTKFSVERSPADGQGKGEGAYDLITNAAANPVVTHRITGGKVGGILEVRDKTVSRAIERLDDLAYTITKSVNSLHEQGVNRYGQKGTKFFKDLGVRERAAQHMSLSDEVENSVNFIATGMEKGAPGDNRIAVAISGLQNMRLMNEGKVTVDDFYNSIVSDVGILTERNREAFNQQKHIITQLNKVRDQISGVSLDEEIANLMQYQQAFDASSKVIQVANHLLEEVLNIGR